MLHPSESSILQMLQSSDPSETSLLIRILNFWLTFFFGSYSKSYKLLFCFRCFLMCLESWCFITKTWFTNYNLIIWSCTLEHTSIYPIVLPYLVFIKTSGLVQNAFWFNKSHHDDILWPKLNNCYTMCIHSSKISQINIYPSFTNSHFSSHFRLLFYNFFYNVRLLAFHTRFPLFLSKDNMNG